ncbi:Uncharacterized protein TCM_035606 [Theobroma cacao]|uniref:Uncharacterized protein n=1 Tax=Theobroma cacao TaxID=3641 RepID=A0A061FJA4_THECC|nr:Uncharacterized protein TCM_035606 [Theobroma cacao]
MAWQAVLTSQNLSKGYEFHVCCCILNTLSSAIEFNLQDHHHFNLGFLCDCSYNISSLSACDTNILLRLKLIFQTSKKFSSSRIPQPEGKTNMSDGGIRFILVCHFSSHMPICHLSAKPATTFRPHSSSQLVHLLFCVSWFRISLKDEVPGLDFPQTSLATELFPGIIRIKPAGLTHLGTKSQATQNQQPNGLLSC